jgi:hypothetical protein
MAIYSNTPRYLWILCSQIFMIMLAPLMDEGLIPYLLFALSLFFVFGSVIARIRKKRFPKILAVIAGIIALLSSFVLIIPGLSPEIVKIGSSICTLSYAAFTFIAILSIAKSVFVNDEVTVDMILGSICTYLLIGMCFAFIYAGINFDGDMGFKVDRFYNYLYFSLTTLTTTGFGDIVPTSAFTKMLSAMEGVIGSMYIAVVVARLVGLHIVSKRTH